MEGSPSLSELAASWLHYLETEGQEETENLRRFYANCIPSHGRQFGITRRGRFCLLPKDAIAGDQVCIPYGSKVPFIFRLREADDDEEKTYMNVGECYVHGAMSGEALGWDGIEEDEFIVS